MLDQKNDNSYNEDNEYVGKIWNYLKASQYCNYKKSC
jgi:hypothetical protein